MRLGTFSMNTFADPNLIGPKKANVAREDVSPFRKGCSIGLLTQLSFVLISPNKRLRNGWIAHFGVGYSVGPLGISKTQLKRDYFNGGR